MILCVVVQFVERLLIGLGEEFGRARALDLIGRRRDKSSQEIIHERFVARYGFLKGQKLSDDVTVMILRDIE